MCDSQDTERLVVKLVLTWKLNIIRILLLFVSRIIYSNKNIGNPIQTNQNIEGTSKYIRKM